VGPPARGAWVALGLRTQEGIRRLGRYLAHSYGPHAGVARLAGSSAMAVTVLGVFAALLLFFYLA